MVHGKRNCQEQASQASRSVEFKEFSDSARQLRLCRSCRALSEKASRTRQLDRAFSNKLTFITVRSLVCEPWAGYYRERTEQACWHALCEDIGQMCKGIVCKFNQPSDEAKANLANEAFAAGG